MSDDVVRRSYERRIKDWGQSYSVPIAYQNIPFDKQGVPLYLQTVLMPAPVLPLNVRGTRWMYSGIFQMNLCSQESNGIADQETLTKTLEAMFGIGPLDDMVRVSRHFSTSPAMTDGPEYVLPCYSMYELINN